MKTKTCTAALFDLDGTLLDTLADLATATNTALARLGFASHPLADFRMLVGEGIERLAERALPETARDSSTLRTVVAAIREEYGRVWAQETRPYPGVPELLEALSQRGVPMAVLSNKPHDFTTMMVARLLSRWHFREVLGARPTVPRKPNPQGAREAATLLGVAPAQIGYLGDTAIDMETARAAGMVPLGALWGFRDAAELEAAGAAALLRTPLEMLAYFEHETR